MKKGTNVIVGIVQLGPSCDHPDVYRLGVYLDVSTTRVQHSIKKLVPDLLIEYGALLEIILSKPF